MRNEEKQHVVCIPYPAQGHITPMLNLAKLLHSHFDFYVTFVNTEHNHNRLLHCHGPNALDGLPSFHFTSIPDGLPPSDPNKTQDIPSLSASTNKFCYNPLKELIENLNETSPKVGFILSDCSMSFSVDVAIELGIPLVFFWTASAASFLCYANYRRLVDECVLPLKDSTSLKRVIDGLPGIEGIQLKNLPNFARINNKDEIMHNILANRIEKIFKSGAPIIFHTLDALEHDIVQAISAMSHSTVYPIGPLPLLVTHFIHSESNSLGSNLWQEDSKCLEWLDSKDPNSVIYVNFGSITVMDEKNIIEMAWGLANSQKNFLWVIRPDLLNGGCASLPPEFVELVEDRGFLASWCDQKAILGHKSVGGFLTHCGWNSILDSISNGVPMICWPFFADQTTNCWLCCEKWGVGLEIEGADIERDQVEQLVKEVMGGERGKGMKEIALRWKNMAEEATTYPCGSSFVKLEELIGQVVIAKANNFT